MPSLADLDAAMLRPGRAVPAVNRVGGGAVAMAGADQPWRVVGRSAAVYQLRQPSGRVLALRCPLAEPTELDPAAGERYRALAGDPALAALRGTDGLLVGDLAYVPDGLAFAGRDLRSVGHPVAVMEWVMGPTVLAAADRACRADDRPFLAALADGWAAAVAKLTAANFRHGDLAPDNALVRPGGGIALVDYDACDWPGSPRPAPGSTTPAYAHPGGTTPPHRLDNFPALVIYASLRLLARWPALREQHGEPPERAGGALLFNPRDLRDPDASALFGALRVLDEPDLKELLATLRRICLGPAADVPPLADVVARLRQIDRGGAGTAGAVRARPATPPPEAAIRARTPTPAAEAPVPRPTLPAAPEAGTVDGRERQRRLTRLNSLLLAGDDDGAQRFWLASGLAGDPDAGRELGPRMAELGRRLLLRRAREAAEQGDSAALLRLWEEGGFEGYRPAAPLLVMVEAARRRADGVDRLRAALDAHDTATVLQLWPQLRGDSLASSLAIRAHAVIGRQVGAAVARALQRGDDASILGAVREAEVNGVAIDPPARRAARAAAARLLTRQELQAAVAAEDRSTLSTLALSGRLEELGALEPATMRAVLRALAWPHLERALTGNDDVAILAAYDPDLFGEEGALAAEQRGRVDLARARVAWLGDIRAALRRRDVGALRALLAKPPPGAETRLSRVEHDRIARLSARGDAVDRLATALRDGPDAAIVAALGEVEAAGAPLPEALDWAAVRGVVDRATLAAAIRAAATADPPDFARLARLLPVARAAMAEGAVGLADGLDFARLEREVLRAAHFDRLRDALANDDRAAIAAAADPDPYGALEHLTEAQRARVDQVLGARRAAAPHR